MGGGFPGFLQQRKQRAAGRPEGWGMAGSGGLSEGCGARPGQGRGDQVGQGRPRGGRSEVSLPGRQMGRWARRSVSPGEVQCQQDGG